MSIKNKDLALIQKYFEEGLNDLEANIFLEKFKQDEDFRADFDLVAISRDEEMQRKRREIIGSLRKPVKTVKRSLFDRLQDWLNSTFKQPSFRIAMATILLIIGMIAIWKFLQTESDPQKIYASYYEKASTDYIIPTVAGSNTNNKDSLIALIRENYNENNYPAVLTSISQLDKNSITAGISILEANALMELKRFEEAQRMLKDMIEKNRAPVYTEQARWYIAMAYLASNETEEAIDYLAEIVEEQDAFKRKEAQSILKVLR